MSPPLVSVVVPVFNAAGMIDGLVEALDSQTLVRSGYEVIFVDDGSTDATADRIAAAARGRRARFRLVRQPKNAGPAAARNAGLSIAEAPIIAFTDADCEPDPEWLVAGLARFDAEPGLAAVEGCTLPKGTPGPLTHQMVNTEGGLYMTCNMFYRRAWLDEIGGFDPRFRLAFLEDSDVALGVLERGGLIRWAPEVLVRHLVLPEGTARFRKEARKRFYNPLLYKKHRALYSRHIAPVVPGLPPLHLKYLASLAALPVPAVLGAPGISVFLLFPLALYARRVLHAYRARTPGVALRALLHPFVQTEHVLRGMIAFRVFSWRI